MSDANTKTVLALLKAGPKTVTELVVTTGLTRQTINKKLTQNSDVILATMTHPKKFYIKGAEHKTVIDESVDKNKSPDPRDAILHGTGGVTFFPNVTHNDYSNFHDTALETPDTGPAMLKKYRDIKTFKDFNDLEAAVKTMYDLLQWRKTLKEFKEFE